MFDEKTGMFGTLLNIRFARLCKEKKPKSKGRLLKSVLDQLNDGKIVTIPEYEKYDALSIVYCNLFENKDSKHVIHYITNCSDKIRYQKPIPIDIIVDDVQVFSNFPLSRDMPVVVGLKSDMKNAKNATEMMKIAMKTEQYSGKIPDKPSDYNGRKSNNHADEWRPTDKIVMTTPFINGKKYATLQYGRIHVDGKIITYELKNSECINC